MTSAEAQISLMKPVNKDLMIDIEDINLTRGPNIKWLKGLSKPWSTYQAAKTLGELAKLSPNTWRIYARHCLRDTVVYGNGRCSFGITEKEGQWRFRFCEGSECEFLYRARIDDALRQSEHRLD